MLFYVFLLAIIYLVGAIGFALFAYFGPMLHETGIAWYDPIGIMCCVAVGLI